MFRHWNRWVKSDSVDRQLVIERLSKEGLQASEYLAQMAFQERGRVLQETLEVLQPEDLRSKL